MKNETEKIILKVDIDCRIDQFGWKQDYIDAVKAVLLNYGYMVDRVVFRESPSGRGLHVWIHLNGKQELSDKGRNKLQFLCGDDQTRVWINQMRIKKRIPQWNKMFSKVIWKRPNHPKYLMRMKKRQLVDMYVKLSNSVRGLQ